MADENDHSQAEDLEPRDPTLADLRDLCRQLNLREARYIVIGGFAIIAASYHRHTIDIDLLVDTSGDNEARVLDAVATLPDGAARQIQPGDVAKWNIVRIADEIVVDLMRSACAIEYDAAKPKSYIEKLDDVEVRFNASSQRHG
jgi:hypothetical protein